MRKIEKRLRERIKTLENDLILIEADREKFRIHFSNRFRWWIQLIGEGRNPSASGLVESDAKKLGEFAWWHW